MYLNGIILGKKNKKIIFMALNFKHPVQCNTGEGGR
jgi:hypothetical protein